MIGANIRRTRNSIWWTAKYSRPKFSSGQVEESANEARPPQNRRSLFFVRNSKRGEARPRTYDAPISAESERAQALRMIVLIAGLPLLFRTATFIGGLENAESHAGWKLALLFLPANRIVHRWRGAFGASGKTVPSPT